MRKKFPKTKLPEIKRPVASIIILFLLFNLCTFSDKSHKKEMTGLLDSVLTNFSALKRFNGSVLVAKKGLVILSKGYGAANIADQAENKTSTLFKIASISKQFTATAVMLLEEQNKLTTSDKIEKYFPGYPGGDKITIHQLLSHTSGMQDPAEPNPGDLLKNPATGSEPGKKFFYSNSGYILLTSIIETVSKEKYIDFLKENIFDKAGMENTGIIDADNAVPLMAQCYQHKGDEYIPVDCSNVSSLKGAGAMYSTVEDLYKWDRALHTEKIIKKNTLLKMYTPVKNNYGYGWWIDTYKGHNYAFHTGEWKGIKAIMSRFWDDEICIIILSNVDDPVFLSADSMIRNILFTDPELN